MSRGRKGKTMGKYKGIDISKWQEDVDFDRVKADGIQFVILREGYRQALDNRFLEYVEGCKRVGLPILGVYHFSYALNPEQARAEADTCISHLEQAGLGKDVIVFFDFEYDTVNQAKDKGVTLGKEDCMAHTEIFCERVRELGYTPGVYSNIDYYRHMYEKELLDRYVFWLAHYTDGEPIFPCVFQQFGSNGHVDGIKGNVDMDWYYGEIQ